MTPFFSIPASWYPLQSKCLTHWPLRLRKRSFPATHAVHLLAKAQSQIRHLEEDVSLLFHTFSQCRGSTVRGTGHARINVLDVGSTYQLGSTPYTSHGTVSKSRGTVRGRRVTPRPDVLGGAGARGAPLWTCLAHWERHLLAALSKRKQVCRACPPLLKQTS